MLTKFIIIFFLVFYVQNSTPCNTNAYILPVGQMDNIIDKYVASVLQQNKLQDLILSPTLPNLQNYIMSILALVGPIFAMAALIIFVVFICSLQMCCWNCCHASCCGKQISASTYSARSVKLLYMCSFIFSTVLIGIAIFAMIINHDLTIVAENSNCAGIDFFNTFMNGNNNNWLGISNIYQSSVKFQTNLNNNILQINNQLSNKTATTTYNSLIAGGTNYQSVQNSLNNCINYTQSITCPDGTSNSCQTTFGTNFCNTSNPMSAYSILNNQFTTNITNQYATNLKNLVQDVAALNANIKDVSSSVSSIVNGLSSFQNSINNYHFNIQDLKSQISSKLILSQNIIYGFYSFIILVPLITIFSIITVICCRKYKIRCCFYLFWIIFVILGFLLFLISGVQYLISIGFIQGCSSYNYFLSSQANLQKLLGGISNSTNNITTISQCILGTGTLTGGLIPNSTLTYVNQFNDLQTALNNAAPTVNFSTVANNLTNNLVYYSINPDKVILDGGSTMQPGTYLNTLNTYANKSKTGSTQTILQDYLVFNTLNCGNNPIQTGSNNQGNNSCINLNDTSTVSTRSALIPNDNIYGTYGNNLYNYATSLQSYIQNILNNDPMINPYANNYFNYYYTLKNYLNPQIIAGLNSFLIPFQNMYNGLSCSFISTQMNFVYESVCNNFTPVMYTLASVNIAISSILALLLGLVYFLIPRLQFYEFLDGDLNAVGEQQNTREFQLQPRQLLETSKSNR